MCQKGDKCKFSHDLQIGRKAQKIDIYTDRRDLKDGEKAAGDMESEGWDQAKLETVVKEKEEKAVKAGRRCASDIICKHFLDAVEAKKYGWFWECPNGSEKCQYRHALPPGYVLKSERKKEEEEKPEEPPIEDVIETERRKITTRTQLTNELFLSWRAKREVDKRAKAEKDQKERAEALKSGRKQMSGREMFEFHPELFVDDDEAAAASDYLADPNDEQIPETILTVTGTSIVATRKGGGAGGDKAFAPIHIEESLFVDMDAPVPDELKDDDDDSPSNNADNASGGNSRGNGKATDEHYEDDEDGGDNQDEDDDNEDDDDDDDNDDEVPKKAEKSDKPQEKKD